MGQTTFTQMSEAVSDLIRIDVGLIERIGERKDVAALFDLDGMWARDIAAKAGADMLAGLVPHERAARDLTLIRVLAATVPPLAAAPPLVPLPGAPTLLVPGDIVLVEAEVRKVVLEHASVMVRYGAEAGDLVRYSPVPLRAVRQVLRQAKLIA